jgi:hypothetical protein
LVRCAPPFSESGVAFDFFTQRDSVTVRSEPFDLIGQGAVVGIHPDSIRRNALSFAAPFRFFLGHVCFRHKKRKSR